MTTLEPSPLPSLPVGEGKRTAVNGLSTIYRRIDRKGHGDTCESHARFCDRARATEPALVFRRRLLWHGSGNSAGPGAFCNRRVAAAVDHADEPHWRHHHDGRHLLRREVWRLDDVDPAQRAGRVFVSRDLSRRLRDGEERPGRAGAWHCRHLVICGGDRWCRPAHGRRAAGRGIRAAVWSPRVLRVDGAGPVNGGSARREIHDQGLALDVRRSVAGHDRHRYVYRRRALYVRPYRTDGRGEFRRGGDRHLRNRRGTGQSGEHIGGGRCSRCRRACATSCRTGRT